MFSATEGCVHVHWRLPYRWQVLRSCTDPWEDPWEDFPLAEQEQIERAYAEPGNNTSSNQTEVYVHVCVRVCVRAFSKLFFFVFFSRRSDIDFTTMMSSGLAVRRLSTASAASKPSHSTFTTHWLWYWKDDSGNWVEFGQVGSHIRSQPDKAARGRSGPAPTLLLRCSAAFPAHFFFKARVTIYTPHPVGCRFLVVACFLRRLM